MNTIDNQIPMLDWCAKIQYPNLKPIVAGTIFVAAKATMQEVEAEVIRVFTEFLPDKFEIKELIRGSIWFVPAKENT